MVLTITDEELVHMKMIVMDGDEREALRFLKERVLARILKREKRKMDVEGKTHL